MPVLNVPFRLIFAVQPAARRRARQHAAAAEGLPVPLCGRFDVLDVKSTASRSAKGIRVMKGFVIAASLALVLSAAPAFAQAAASGQARPAAACRQRTPPQTPPVPARRRSRRRRSRPGAKIGFVNLQRIAQKSVDGKAASQPGAGADQKKQTEGADKAKQLQANQQKLQTSGARHERRGARAAREGHRAAAGRRRSASSRTRRPRSTSCSRSCRANSRRSCSRCSQQLAKEKGLHVLLSAPDAGVIWADPGIDLTSEAIKRLDAATAAPSPVAAHAANREAPEWRIAELQIARFMVNAP